jgi:hypothetical protein
MLIVAERKNTGDVVISPQREADFDVLKVRAMGLMGGARSELARA